MGSQPAPSAGNASMAIRLAGEKDPAADLYNAYHFVTQLAGLYAQAGLVDKHPKAPAMWSELTDLAMIDLGELFSIWDLAAQGDRGGAGRPFGVDSRLRLGSTTACQRALALIQRLNLWTSTLQWVRLLRLAERRWQRLAERLAIARPLQATQLCGLRAASERRSARLTAQLELYLTEQLRIKLNYQKAMEGSKKIG